MVKPYSLDLRERVVAACKSGGTCREVAARFSIGVSSVVRWSQRFRQTNSVAPKPMGGDRNSRLTEVRGWLLERIAREPDLTLEELRLVLAREQQLSVSYGCVQRFVTKERLTFKKNALRQRARSP